MNKITPIVCAMLMVLLWSCQRKELPEPVIETPDFVLQGSMNGQDFQVIAGEGGLQAHGVVEQDEWGVFRYSGGFVHPTCSGCPGEWLVSIRSQEIHSPVDEPVFENDIQVGAYPFATWPTFSDFQTLTFFPELSGMTSISWVFPDGQNFSTEQPVVTLTETGPVDVTMNYNWNNQCSASITKTVSVGTPTNYAYPVLMQALDPSTVYIEGLFDVWPDGLMLGGVEVDGVPIEVLSEPLYVTIAPLVPHEISVLFFHPDGVVGRYSVTAIFSPENCIVPFYWTYAAIELPEIGTVSVAYVHPNGQVYSTVDPSNGTGTSHFEITAIEPYDLSLNGLPTYRVSVAMNGVLVNTSNAADTLLLNDVQGHVLFVGSD